MSTTTSRAPAGGASKDGDICPVCKSSRYLNPNMRFLVNPECYHKMCESCVDRIFSHGPAPCPIAGCKRTLRKVKFRSQTFEDIEVEREVDIRRRVARVFNKTESDFETLRDYNDYLEVVEETTWNLISKIDLEATERKLRLYEEAQKLERNITTRAVQQNDPSLPADGAQVVLKKGAGQRKAPIAAPGRAAEPLVGSENGPADKGFYFHGLKKVKAPEPEKPLDPFGGYVFPHQYFVVQDDYDVDWLTQAKHDPYVIANGFDMRDFYVRALSDAFTGFHVFVEDEIEAREKNVSADATVGAALAMKDVNMDDVF